MPKLSDTQLVILSTACARPDRRVLPLPKRLRGGAATKVIDGLMAKGLVEEVEAQKGDPVWRNTDDGRHMTLVATPAADAALDGGTAEATALVPQPDSRPGPAAPQKAARAKEGKVAARPRPRTRKAAEAVPAPVQPRTRSGTKQAELIAMLTRTRGASIAEIADALGWQPHTVRGAFAGALKKKLGLAVISEKVEGRGRIYRISG